MLVVWAQRAVRINRLVVGAARARLARRNKDPLASHNELVAETQRFSGLRTDEHPVGVELLRSP